MAAAAPRNPTLIWALLALDGRINREVFWLGNIGCGLVAVAMMMPSIDPATGQINLAPMSPLVFAAMLWTEIALAVKRLHDKGVSGWFAIAFAIPIIGIAAFLVIGLMPGDKGANAYGTASNMRGRG
ncbi:MAG: DUF805 domain-containing protein [Pseudomonadota bacterium]